MSTIMLRPSMKNLHGGSSSSSRGGITVGNELIALSKRSGSGSSNDEDYEKVTATSIGSRDSITSAKSTGLERFAEEPKNNSLLKRLASSPILTFNKPIRKKFKPPQSVRSFN